MKNLQMHDLVIVETSGRAWRETDIDHIVSDWSDNKCNIVLISGSLDGEVWRFDRSIVHPATISFAGPVRTE